VTTYQTLSLLTSFEYIMLLTDGGPGLYRTEVWALTAYHRALKTYFGHNQWGYGAAWGFVLVIIGIVMSIIYLRLFRFGELVQELRWPQQRLKPERDLAPGASLAGRFPMLSLSLAFFPLCWDMPG
jgi:ABC-type amino acid transport system permease subunit